MLECLIKINFDYNSIIIHFGIDIEMLIILMILLQIGVLMILFMIVFFNFLFNFLLMSESF